jgi:tRNA threonylcarbamoyladenosine biosynthesis protein TsaB
MSYGIFSNEGSDPDMKVLGIDTSTTSGSIGLIHGERVISEYTLNLSVTHSERLLDAIDLVLRKSRHALGDLDGFAISLGPGSFTGVRIGVSTVKGLAYAVQKPVVGVSTLDVLASQVSPTPYLICPIIDARKGEVYSALYRYERINRLKRLSDYQAVRPEALFKTLQEPTIFLGNGVKTYGDDLTNSLGSFAMVSPTALHIPHGSAVARLGVDLLLRKEVLDLATFIPLYVRLSEAEIKWQEKHPD